MQQLTCCLKHQRAHRIRFDDILLMKALFSPGHSNKCSGKQVHYSCILNVRDIPLLYMNGSSTVMFYNKYLMEYDHVVMDCMERG